MPDDSSATAYPIVIAEWQRNSREIIRIALDQYKGRDIVDARAWWRNEDGNWRPGRNGLTLSLKHLPSLAEGLGDAARRARQLGIIEGVEYRPKDRTAAERQRRYRQRRNGGVTA